MSPPRPRTLRPLLAVVGLALVVAACGSDVDAASMGDASLTRGELNEILDEVLPESAGGNHPLTPATAGSPSASGILGQFIFAEAIAQELEARGTPVTDEALAVSAETLAAEPALDLDTAAGQLSIRLDAIFTTADDWIAAGTEGVAVELPEYLCSSHILVETEEEAAAVVERLGEGEDFAELAVEVSIGPTGPDGGDLGCAATAGFVPEFTEGARAVAPVGVTGPVESQFGWHVIDVRAIGPLSAETHPEVDPAVVEQEAAAARQVVGQPLIEELRAGALERIDRDLELDSRYGTWDPTAGVVPPAGVTQEGPTDVGGG